MKLITKDILSFIKMILEEISPMILKCFELKQLKQTPENFEEFLEANKEFFEQWCKSIISFLENGFETLKYP